MSFLTTEIDDELAAFGELVSILNDSSPGLFDSLCNTLNTMIDSVPCGEIATIFVVPGITPDLDPTIWQECNGAEITEQLSPMRGQFTPDMRDRYLKGAPTFNSGTIGNPGGSNTSAFPHNHTGFTEYMHPTLVDVDPSDGAWEPRPHRHEIFTDNTAINVEPAHFTIKHYIKIR
jgi:hypothetical protein